ncbi:hypothetical protein NBRC116588_26130 [Pyruvatibacter sp. HU-CL02332]|uniref:hypothetical protein n=1 Tax=Pyruvatibacter sp. HU-CL02332 TaxID=3127650 RepID=UPI0031022CA9
MLIQVEVSGDYEPAGIKPSVAQIYMDQQGVNDLCEQLDALELPGDHTHNFSDDWGGSELSLGPKHNPNAHYGHHLELIFFGVGHINAEVEVPGDGRPPGIVEIHVNARGRDELIRALLSLLPHKKCVAYATKSFEKIADGVLDGKHQSRDGMTPLTYLEFCLIP